LPGHSSGPLGWVWILRRASAILDIYNFIEILSVYVIGRIQLNIRLYDQAKVKGSPLFFPDLSINFSSGSETTNGLIAAGV
jgi:hypothetical protein